MGKDSNDELVGSTAQVRRQVAAFWLLGLMNNFLYVAMNAGAHNIKEGGIGFVYLAGVGPNLFVKVTGAYWLHKLSYRCRLHLMACCMVSCLFIVAWCDSINMKLVGVGIASFQGGLGEATILAMATFYEGSRYCLVAWSSGTGFAGIFGYSWSIFWTQYMDACFQLQLMCALWIPLVFLATFHLILGAPKIDNDRGDVELSESSEEPRKRPITESLTSKERLRYILSLWKYIIPLFLVYASEYITQAGMWASMGFPTVHDKKIRRNWYQWANFTYQVGVFFSRSLGGLRVLPFSWLWAGPIAQCGLTGFFFWAAWVPFGDWWLIGPALCVGFLGGFVYVQAFVKINHTEPEEYRELALSSACMGDTAGKLAADIIAILVQGCIFAHHEIMDTVPTYKCGSDIWDDMPPAAKKAKVLASLCFPGM